MDRPFFYIMLHTQGVTDSSSVVSTTKKDIRLDVFFVLFAEVRPLDKAGMLML